MECGKPTSGNTPKEKMALLSPGGISCQESLSRDGLPCPSGIWLGLSLHGSCICYKDYLDFIGATVPLSPKDTVSLQLSTTLALTFFLSPPSQWSQNIGWRLCSICVPVKAEHPIPLVFSAPWPGQLWDSGFIIAIIYCKKFLWWGLRDKSLGIRLIQCPLSNITVACSLWGSMSQILGSIMLTRVDLIL